jgi:protein-arginine kinase activator protein McsA
MKGICACGKEAYAKPQKLKNKDGTMRPYVCKECSIKKVAEKLKGKTYDLSSQKKLMDAAAKYKKKGAMVNER